MAGWRDPFEAGRLRRELELEVQLREQTQAMRGGSPSALHVAVLEALKQAMEDLTAGGTVAGQTFEKLPKVWQVSIRQAFPNIIEKPPFGPAWPDEPRPRQPWDRDPQPYPDWFPPPPR
jgi:hypothetical protein